MCNILKLLTIPCKCISDRSTISSFNRLPLSKILKPTSFSTKRYKLCWGEQTLIVGPPHLNFCNKAYDINTNISKDVILYKYENPKFFKILNIFGICQFMFWIYLSHFAFTTLRDAPVEPKDRTELKWFERVNLGENKYRNGITIMTFLVGYGILASVWMYTLRSVRFLILRKGGQDVTLVTYGPFGHNRLMTVPLKHISAQQPRDKAESVLPLKVRNRSLYYVLDMRGEFRNTRLYDYTAGLHRRF